MNVCFTVTRKREQMQFAGKSQQNKIFLCLLINAAVDGLVWGRFFHVFAALYRAINKEKRTKNEKKGRKRVKNRL